LSQVDIAVGFHPPPQFLHGSLVAFLSCADEIVIGAIETREHVAEHGRVLVRERDRRNAFLLGRLLHLLAVLVGARKKEHVLAIKPLKPRQNIRCDRRIGVADMRNTVGIEIGVVM
jgi:hypothetical protein